MLVIAMLDSVLLIGSPSRCWLWQFPTGVQGRICDLHARPMLVIGALDPVQKLVADDAVENQSAIFSIN